MDSDTRAVEPDDDQDVDPEEYDDGYDEDEGEQPPARMPGNVLGPAVFLGAGAVGGLLLGGYAFISALVTGRTEVTTGLLLLLGGALLTMLVIGLRQRWGIAQGFAVALGALLGLSGLVTFRDGGGVLGLVLGVALVWCLTRRDAKDWFGIA